MRFIPYVDPGDYKLSLSEVKIGAGQKFDIIISNVSGVAIRVAYAFDDGQIQTFPIRLNYKGRATVSLPSSTKGICRIVGFQIAGHREWIRSDETIAVN